MVISETEKRIRRVITEAMRLDIPPDELEGRNLEAELGLTSIDTLEILIRTEIEFGIRIEDEDLNGELVKSVATLDAYVNSKLQSR